jgi:glycosyltransferase involved in cell wall biosynthesis
MRVLILHNRYKERGGEDSVFEAEIELLEKHGHTVEPLLFDNAEIDAERSLADSARLAATTLWSRESHERIQSKINVFKPDIAHFHNTLPLISPSGYYAARSARVPVIQTLHNLRLVCPASSCFRDGAPCELCVTSKTKLSALRYACYRSSRAETAVVSGMVLAHRLRGTWAHAVDTYIALSENSRRILVRGGVPAEKITVKPNFSTMAPTESLATRKGFVTIGRLSPEKGVQTSVRAWVQSGLKEPYTLVGTGPLEETLAVAARSNHAVRGVGLQSRERVAQYLGEALALVFPSECYENFPVTLVEAFAMGTPVIASRRGAMPEIVEDGKTGLLFNAGDHEDLAEKVQWATTHPEEMAKMGENARQVFAEKYTPEQNLKQLISIYEAAIESRSVAARS